MIVMNSTVKDSFSQRFLFLSSLPAYSIFCLRFSYESTSAIGHGIWNASPTCCENVVLTELVQPRILRGMPNREGQMMGNSFLSHLWPDCGLSCRACHSRCPAASLLIVRNTFAANGRNLGQEQFLDFCTARVSQSGCLCNMGVRIKSLHCNFVGADHESTAACESMDCCDDLHVGVLVELVASGWTHCDGSRGQVGCCRYAGLQSSEYHLVWRAKLCSRIPLIFFVVGDIVNMNTQSQTCRCVRSVACFSCSWQCLLMCPVGEVPSG